MRVKTKTVRQFTHEDVRLALNDWASRAFVAPLTAPIMGIKVTLDAGFLVEECPPDEQPRYLAGDEEKP